VLRLLVRPGFMAGLGFARLPKQDLAQHATLIGIFEKS